MLRNTLLAAVLAVSTLFSSIAFAGDVTDSGVLVAPRLVKDTEFWKFRTRIMDGATEGTNFADRYTVVTWGCGTECQTGVAIDRVTGKLIWLPTAAYGYNFDRDSRLLVVNPNAREDYLRVSDLTGTGKLPDWLFREMYTLKNGHFVQVGRDKMEPGSPTLDEAFAHYYIIPVNAD